jgi:hypothetical protein
MALKTTYREYIIEKLWLEYLYSGIIPTADVIEDDLLAYQVNHPDLTLPASKRTDFDVERGDNSSAALIRDVANIVSDDVAIITRELYRLAKESQRFYERWSYESKRLSGKAAQLENRVDSLLLLTEDTAGYFAHVSDVFADMNKIDTDATTARINLHDTAVVLNPSADSATDTSGGTLLDVSGVSESDVMFALLSKRPGTSYFTLDSSSLLSNIFKSQDNSWVGVVASSSPGEMICELRAHVSHSKDLEVSKISFEYTGPTSTSRGTVTCQYSVDGYTWYLVPTDEATKTLGPNMSWYFPLTKMRWLKLIFTKPSHDAEPYRYEFAARHLRLYGHSYNTELGNTLTTRALQALDTQSNPINFAKVALEVCEELPTDTDIRYYVAASRDGSTWTEWQGISPVDRTALLYPKAINFGGADWKDNKIESSTDKLDTTLSSSTSQMEITRNFLNVDIGLNGYRFKDESFGVVNTAILLSTGDDPDPVGNSVIMWRNIRYKESYPDQLTVRDMPRGWGFDGSLYTCYFKIVDSNGVLIDFGSGECTIDGTAVSGVTKVLSGVHKFSTSSDNWNDIADVIVELSSDITSEETLKSIDPLYPYNHKLLIEGFPYIDNFVGERPYTGTDISAEFYATRISLFDLENNIDITNGEYGHFAVRGIGDASDPTLAVIVQYDVSNPDYTNELSLVEWRAGASDASLYNSIKLKAVLDTTDVSVSPILTSYRLRLGV